MNTPPNNPEHYEARQNEVNEQRNEIKKQLNQTEKEKLQLIEECAKTLKENGVPFLIFGKSGFGIWQFNHLVQYPEYNFSDNEQKEIYQNLMLIIENFASFINNTYKNAGPNVLVYHR